MTNQLPKKGKLLIAEPSILNDASFQRTIVLLTEHTTKSTVGFILNRATQYVLKDLLPDIHNDFVIYEGGPVEQDNLYFVHRIPHLLPDSIEVGNGIYWGGNFEQLKMLLHEQTIQATDIRFFLGYSGWGSHQLNDELKTNSWFITKNNYKNILTEDAENIWKKKLLEKGGEYQIWANAPGDIQMN